MVFRTTAALLATVLCTSSVFAQGTLATLLQKAQAAFRAAQQAEATLDEKPAGDRTRSEYIKVITSYQLVYNITPHTSYADDSLMAVARLYEEIADTEAAIRTLAFLVRDYPE